MLMMLAWVVAVGVAVARVLVAVAVAVAVAVTVRWQWRLEVGEQRLCLAAVASVDWRRAVTRERDWDRCEHGHGRWCGHRDEDPPAEDQLHVCGCRWHGSRVGFLDDGGCVRGYQ